MPVQYVQQYIPTNTQALQGVLSEYQQAYDQNLARELEIQDQYSAIPTVDAADTQMKNQILDNFANTMGDIEKKYNYDRASSSYSKELARKIGQLRQNDFWAYNERKKQMMRSEAEMKQKLGAGYYSQYSPSQATYTDQTALNNYRPIDTKDIFTMARAIGEEYSNANPRTTPIKLTDPRTGQPFAMNYRTEFGFLDPNEMNAFLQDKKGQDMITQSLLTAGIPQDLVNDPALRNAAIGGLQSGLVGKLSEDRVGLPSLGTGSGSNSKISPPWIPIGNITINEGANTPEKLKNTRQGEKSTDYETSQYYDAVKNNVLNNQDNIDAINRGKEAILQAAPNLDSNIANDLFSQLTDKYLTEGTGKFKAAIDPTGRSVNTRTFIYDYLDSRGIQNPGRLANDISSTMDNWYATDLRSIKGQITDKLDKGLSREYSISIPPIQPKTDTEQVITFVKNIVSQYAASPAEGESTIIDPKKLAKFEEAEGDISIAMLQSPGRVPVLRLVKGTDVKNGTVLDLTMNPNISGYAAWAQLAEKTNTPTLLSDAYFSNIHMTQQAEYSIDSSLSSGNTNQTDVFKSYLKDMVRSDPKYVTQSEKELSDTVTKGLKGISWKEDVDDYGQSTFRIYRNGREIEIDNPIGSVDELMYRLSNMAKVE